MWNFIARKHAHETDEAGETLSAGEDGRQWVWISFAPEFRLMIAAVVGPRTLDTAKEVVAATKARVAGIPVFFSDGFTCYLAALIAAFHVVTTCARTGKRGRPRKPLCEPHPDLVYGQLVKQKKHGTLLTLSPRVVLGAERLTQLGFTISTAAQLRAGAAGPAAPLGARAAVSAETATHPRLAARHRQARKAACRDPGDHAEPAAASLGAGEAARRGAGAGPCCQERGIGQGTGDAGRTAAAAPATAHAVARAAKRQ